MARNVLFTLLSSSTACRDSRATVRCLDVSSERVQSQVATCKVSGLLASGSRRLREGATEAEAASLPVPQYTKLVLSKRYWLG